MTEVTLFEPRSIADVASSRNFQKRQHQPGLQRPAKIDGEALQVSGEFDFRSVEFYSFFAAVVFGCWCWLFLRLLKEMCR